MSYNENNERAKHSPPSLAPWPHTLRVGPKGQGPRIEVGRLLFFDVVGEPKAQPRTQPVNMGKHARLYTPPTADEWKHTVRAFAIQEIKALGGWPLIAPGVAAEVHLGFRFQRPKSHLRTGRFSGILKSSAPKHHTQKPDKDNLEKAVLDALGHFDKMPPLVVCDDCQFIGGRTDKRWADPGEEPGVAIAIMELEAC